MLFRPQYAIAALALALTSAVGTSAVLAQDHNGHHPDGKAPGTQAAPQSPNATPAQSGGMGGKMGEMMGQGDMMCGDMKRMMSMMQDMHAMMKEQSGMMATRVEADIARFKSDLKITEAQLPQWNRFADAVRRMAKAMEEAHRQLMAPAGDTTLATRLGGMEKTLLDHLYSVKAVEEALQPLYASLSDEQKKVADTMNIGSMGMM